MNNSFVISVAMSVIVASGAHAQVTPELPAVASDSVLVYQADYFASSSPNTAQDMVSRIPGFSINNGDSVRGFAGAGGNVLINGARPASKSDEVASVLGRTAASRVERIELIRGAVPGVDMQGHSVVANVILKNEVSRQHTLQAQHYEFDGGPSLPGGRYEYSSTHNDTTTGLVLGRVVAMNDSTGRGSLLRQDSTGAVLRAETTDSQFDGGGWSARFNRSMPISPGRLELTAGTVSYDYDEVAVYRTANDRRDIVTGQAVDAADFAARLQSNMSARSTLESRLIYEQEAVGLVSESSAPGNLQRFVSDRETQEAIARTLLRWNVHDRLTVDSSAELAYNSMDTTQRFFVNSAEVPLPLGTTRVNELRAEVGSQATFNLRENLKLEAGARIERSTIRQTGTTGAERTFNYVKPRLALSWDQSATRQLRVRVERELGQLNFSDFAASSSLTNDQVLGGNLDLRPQQRWISEAVLEQRFGTRGVISLTLRHDEITDVVDEMPLPGNMTAIGNIGKGTLDRAAVNLRLPMDQLGFEGARLTLSAQYDHTRVTDPTTGFERSISGQRPFRGRVNFEQDVQDINMTWGFNYNPYYREATYNPDQQRTRELRNHFQLFAEKTFNNGVSARAEYTIWDDFRVIRQGWTGRSDRQLAYIEEQRTDPRDYLQLRIRKTF